jgi:type IV pilus assembly protein PilM
VGGQGSPNPAEVHQEPGFFTPVDPMAPGVPVAPAPSHLPATTGGDAGQDALKIQVFNAIAPLLAELVQELRRSLDYYRSKVGDAPLHEMLLIGGTAKLKNLAAFIEAELGVPTRVANPLQKLQVSSKNFSQDYLEDIATLFPVCIGLAATELVAPPPAKKKK